MGSWKNSVNVSILGSELVNDRGGKFENGIDAFEIYHFSLFLRFFLMKQKNSSFSSSQIS